MGFLLLSTVLAVLPRMEPVMEDTAAAAAAWPALCAMLSIYRSHGRLHREMGEGGERCGRGKREPGNRNSCVSCYCAIDQPIKSRTPLFIIPGRSRLVLRCSRRGRGTTATANHVICTTAILVLVLHQRLARLDVPQAQVSQSGVAALRMRDGDGEDKIEVYVRTATSHEHRPRTDKGRKPTRGPSHSMA